MHCLGGFVVTMLYGLAHLTADVDVVLITPRGESERLLKLAGKGSDLHQIPNAPGYRVLQTLMENRRVKQAGLLPIFGSRGVASEVFNGKRAISKAQAKKLGKFFGVSPAVCSELKWRTPRKIFFSLDCNQVQIHFVAPGPAARQRPDVGLIHSPSGPRSICVSPLR